MGTATLGLLGRGPVYKGLAHPASSGGRIAMPTKLYRKSESKNTALKIPETAPEEHFLYPAPNYNL